jgi:Flp pilus assembly protein TadG
MNRVWSGRKARERGANLIEFALVALLLCLLLLVFVDFGRMLLVYNSVANAARAGVRYAIVHGANRTGGGADGTSDCTDHTEVDKVVKNFANSAPLYRTRLTVTVEYLDGCSNAVGSLVQVTADYPYDPLLGYFPLSFTLRGRSQGRIAF